MFESHVNLPIRPVDPRSVDDGPEFGSPVRAREVSYYSAAALLEGIAAADVESEILSNGTRARQYSEEQRPGDLSSSTFIDWAAPGSALHLHQNTKRWTTDTTVQPSPSQKAAATRPASSGSTKTRQSASQRAERGPKLAFGGREMGFKQSRLIHDSPQVNAALEGPVSKKITKARVASSKPDPWLSDWQPKTKAEAPTTENSKTHLTKSPVGPKVPPLEWAKPMVPSTLATAKPREQVSVPQGKERQKRKLLLKLKEDSAVPASPIAPRIAEGAVSMSPKQALLSKLGLFLAKLFTALASLPKPQQISDSEQPLAQLSSQQSAELKTASKAGHASTQEPSSKPVKSGLFRLKKKTPALPSAPPSTSLPEEVEAPRDQETAALKQCQGCGRTFAPEAHARHSKICAKVFKKECAAYKSEKAGSGRAQAGSLGAGDAQDRLAAERTVSLSAVSAVASAPKHKRKEVADVVRAEQSGKAGKLPKWKQQSAQLRAAMLAARPGKLGEAVAAFPGAYAEDDSLVPCPHCGRRFAELTAERHIPKCKDTIHKASRLVAGGGKAAHMRKPTKPVKRY